MLGLSLSLRSFMIPLSFTSSATTESTESTESTWLWVGHLFRHGWLWIFTWTTVKSVIVYGFSFDPTGWLGCGYYLLSSFWFFLVLMDYKTLIFTTGVIRGDCTRVPERLIMFTMVIVIFCRGTNACLSSSLGNHSIWMFSNYLMLAFFIRRCLLFWGILATCSANEIWTVLLRC